MGAKCCSRLPQICVPDLARYHDHENDDQDIHAIFGTQGVLRVVNLAIGALEPIACKYGQPLHYIESAKVGEAASYFPGAADLTDLLLQSPSLPPASRQTEGTTTPSSYSDRCDLVLLQCLCVNDKSSFRL